MILTPADVGREIVLAAFEDQPEEVAEVISVSADMVVCQLSGSAEDDGLRECLFDQVKGYAS